MATSQTETDTPHAKLPAAGSDEEESVVEEVKVVEKRVVEGQKDIQESPTEVIATKTSPKLSFKNSLKSDHEAGHVPRKAVSREEQQKIREQSTVRIDGVPIAWQEDTARKRLLKALNTQFQITVVSLHKDLHSNLWTLSLASKKEAEEMVGKTFHMDVESVGSRPLNIIGVEN